MSSNETNPVERLSEQILADAQRKAGRTQKKADREAGKIAADARQQADAIAQRAEQGAQQRADRECRTLLASVPLEILRHRLACQEDVLQQVRQQAQAQGYGLEGEPRYRLLVGLTTQAVQAIDAGACVVTLSEADRQILGERLIKEVGQQVGCRLQLDTAPSRIRGGVIVRSADGRRLYDNSLGERFARLWEDARAGVASILYPDVGQSTTGGTPDDAGA